MFFFYFFVEDFKYLGIFFCRIFKKCKNECFCSTKIMVILRTWEFETKIVVVPNNHLLSNDCFRFSFKSRLNDQALFRIEEKKTLKMDAARKTILQAEDFHHAELIVFAININIRFLTPASSLNFFQWYNHFEKFLNFLKNIFKIFYRDVTKISEGFLSTTLTQL